MLILNVFGKTYQRTGTKKDGTEFKVAYQEAEILREGRRPRVVEVSTPRDGAYPEGLYTLDEKSYRPDMYDRLSLSPYLRLLPLDDAILIATKYESATSRSSVKKEGQK